VGREKADNVDYSPGEAFEFGIMGHITEWPMNPYTGQPMQQASSVRPMIVGDLDVPQVGERDQIAQAVRGLLSTGEYYTVPLGGQ
jgi:hypothetical protein